MDAEGTPEQDALHQPSTTQKDLPRAVVAPFSFESSSEEPLGRITASLGSTQESIRNGSRTKCLGATTSERLPRRLPRRLSLQQKRRQLARIREGRRTVNVLLPAGRPILPAAEGVSHPPAADGHSLTPLERHPMTDTTSSAGHPPNKKLKLVCKKSARKLEFEAPPLQRALSRGKSMDKGSVDACDESARSSTSRSIPCTPLVLRRKTLVKTKSTEERQLEEMLQLQQEVAEQCRKNAENFRAAILGSGQPVNRTIIPITKPVEFHFHTSSWLKRHPVSKSIDEFKEMDFPALLRSSSCPARLPKGGCTIPKPFKLSKQNKRKLVEEDGPEKFVSMAEQVEAFFNRTPLRFHLRSRLQQNVGPSPVKLQTVKLTNPKSPLFGTNRCSQVTCKHAAEPVTESQKPQRYKCQAQELDPRSLRGGLIHSKKQSVKESPEPTGFNQEHEKRTQERGAKREQPGQQNGGFLSRSCPTKILVGVLGAPERKYLASTVPKPPVFALKNRVHDHAHVVEEEKLPVLRAYTMPHHGVPFKPQSLDQRQSQLAPFSFDTRDKERLAKKLKRLEDLRKEAVPVFKARLLPAFDKVVLPQKKVKARTLQGPFHLQVDERAEKTPQTEDGEPKKQNEAAGFSAHLNPIIHPEYFAPKKDSPNLLDKFKLVTERHAKGKGEFEKRLTELLVLKENLEEEKRLGKEEQKAEEQN